MRIRPPQLTLKSLSAILCLAGILAYAPFYLLHRGRHQRSLMYSHYGAQGEVDYIAVDGTKAMDVLLFYILLPARRLDAAISGRTVYMADVHSKARLELEGIPDFLHEIMHGNLPEPCRHEWCPLRERTLEPVVPPDL